MCVAVADVQTAGRGRAGRSWAAPSGAALLLSAGFRPLDMGADRTWRLAATVSLAMASAAERVAGLPDGAVRLKWPNDLVTFEPVGVRKLGGVLGETDGLGSDDPRVVVGIGVNVDWAASDFPPEIAATMTSLRETAGRSVDREALLRAFLEELATRRAALSDGLFDAPAWTARQATTGRAITVETSDGQLVEAIAVGVDPETGALRFRTTDGREITTLVGEVTHVRLAPATVRV